MLDLTINSQVLTDTVDYCREKGITLPTFAMMEDPAKIPAQIQETLRSTGLWDVHPASLYRITWKNAPREHGGLFGGVNHVVIPPALSGCRLLSEKTLSRGATGCGRSPAVPHPAPKRIWRPPYRGHWRQTCALGP